MANFQEQLTELIPSLRRYALSLTFNDADADDLVQDCVERAITRSHLFAPGTNLRAWLFTIMRNCFLSDRRKAALRSMVDIEDVTAALAVPGHHDTNLEVRDFLAIFNKLSDSDREVLTLVGSSGLSYKEAAEVMQVELGTVRSRLSRARSKLQQFKESADRTARRVPSTIQEVA